MKGRPDMRAIIRPNLPEPSSVLTSVSPSDDVAGCHFFIPLFSAYVTGPKRNRKRSEGSCPGARRNVDEHNRI